MPDRRRRAARRAVYREHLGPVGRARWRIDGALAILEDAGNLFFWAVIVAALAGAFAVMAVAGLLILPVSGVRFVLLAVVSRLRRDRDARRSRARYAGDNAPLAVADLASPRADRRRIAAQHLRCQADAAMLEPLLQAIGEAEPPHCDAALGVLADWLGDAAPERNALVARWGGWRPVMRRLRDDCPGAEVAFRLLVDAEVVAAFGLLWRYAVSGGYEAPIAARLADLARLDPERLAKRLPRLLRSPEPAVRAAAVRLADRLGPEPGLAARRTALGDADQAVRLAAVSELDAADQRRRELLHAALDDPEWPVRLAALTSLRGRADVPAERLLPLAAGHAPDWVAAAERLADSDDPRGLAWLVAEYEGHPSETRREVLWRLLRGLDPIDRREPSALLRGLSQARLGAVDEASLSRAAVEVGR